MLFGDYRKPVDPTQKTLDLMDSSRFQFYPTGSRFFGTSTLHSDWDFYVEASIEAKMWLEANGFERQLGNPLYSDGLCEAIYLRANVHIQLVNDLVLKSKVQEVLNSSEYMKNFGHLSKNLNRTVWMLVAQALREGGNFSDESSHVAEYRKHNLENSRLVLQDYIERFGLCIPEGTFTTLRKLLQQAGY